MERRYSVTARDECNRNMYQWHQGRPRPPMADSNHWRRPRSRSPVSYRRPLPVERRHGYGYQPSTYGQSASRNYYARPATDRCDRNSRRPSPPPSKRPRLEQSHRESSRDGSRDRQPSPTTARQCSAVATVSHTSAAPATSEPCVTFPELWGTHLTEAMERQLDGWREETRQVLDSDPQSARGHSVAGGSGRASSVRSSRDGSQSKSSRPVEMRAGSKRSHDDQMWSHDGQRRESSCAGSWRDGNKRSLDDVQDECPSPAKMFINMSHPRFSRY